MNKSDRLLGKAEIARLIPHAGKMCLLDGVFEWDSEKIRCVARSHLDAGNPLRTQGILRTICGVEYASQAIAVHGSLAAGVAKRPKSGFLVSLRDVSCFAERLDASAEDLIVDAAQILADEARAIYQFSLGTQARPLLAGRATVVLDLML